MNVVFGSCALSPSVTPLEGFLNPVALLNLRPVGDAYVTKTVALTHAHFQINKYQFSTQKAVLRFQNDDSDQNDLGSSSSAFDRPWKMEIALLEIEATSTFKIPIFCAFCFPPKNILCALSGLAAARGWRSVAVAKHKEPPPSVRPTHHLICPT